MVERRTRLEQSSQFEALIIGALGLAGRYLGGQATHQGQRFWARGEDPDQFAGWFGQSNEPGNTLCFRFKGRVGARFTWKPSRWSIPLFRWLLPVEGSGGICSTRIDFQLGTNAADSNGLIWQREGGWQKNSMLTPLHRSAAARRCLGQPCSCPKSDRWSSSFACPQPAWNAGLAWVIPSKQRKMRRKSAAI